VVPLRYGIAGETSSLTALACFIPIERAKEGRQVRLIRKHCL
jgi:hypothetical protein